MKPLVSIIVPLYNAAPYIGETLNSIILSTYRPIEVIVVDDGSTDDSFAQAQIIAKEYPEIHIYQQQNAGVSAARNHAIRKANGEWILPVDADDKISPTYIEHAIDSIRDNIRVIGCRAHMFGARNGEWKLPEYSPGLLARKNIIHVSSLFRKADWELVGGFCEEDIFREDWDFWLSMMELGGEYLRLDEVGLYYRVLPHSRRSKAKSQKKTIVDAINRRHSAFLEKHLGGPLNYHRSWSKFINFFRSTKQVGDYKQWMEGEKIFQKRNTLRLINGIVVKQFATPNVLRGIIYGTLSKSKAQRSYEYALRMKGLTPTPIAYREIRLCGILRESWYACSKSECQHTFNELIGRPDFPNRETILTAIGQFTATLHKRHILHQDYSGGNILFNKEGTKIEVIDLNRIQFCSSLTHKKRLQNFERLNIDREALRTIATAYAIAMGEDPNTTAEYIIAHRWKKHIKQGITNL